jgi:hypothetical protein
MLTIIVSPLALPAKEKAAILDRGLGLNLV